MKSTHECDHEIDRSGITKNVICHESHIYRPFSNHKSGAVTNVMQKLQYTRQRPTVSSTRGDHLQLELKYNFKKEKKEKRSKQKQTPHQKKEENKKPIKIHLLPKNQQQKTHLLTHKTHTHTHTPHTHNPKHAPSLKKQQQNKFINLYQIPCL